MSGMFDVPPMFPLPAESCKDWIYITDYATFGWKYTKDRGTRFEVHEIINSVGPQRRVADFPATPESWPDMWKWLVYNFGRIAWRVAEKTASRLPSPPERSEGAAQAMERQSIPFGDSPSRMGPRAVATHAAVSG